METSNNEISGEAIVSAIAGLMFFSPLVEKNIKFDQSFSSEEKDFIMGYVQVGFVNLILLLIVLLTTFVNIFWIQPYLSWVISMGSIAIYTITIISIIACANSLSMRGPNERVVQKIQNKGQILKSYTPIVNFYLRFKQDNYSTPYRGLKESILLWTIFIFGASLLGGSFGLGILIVIAIRVILLLANIDIIPLSIKNAINNSFLCNPEETISYLSSKIYSKIRKTDYENILQVEKLSYQQGQKFGIGTVIQYILFISILFLMYRFIDLSIYQIIVYIAIVLRIIRVIIFYVNKRTILRIPILSEITSLLFH